MKTNVMRLLDAEHVDYVVKPHRHAVFTSEEAAAERGVELCQIVKTMLVQCPSGDVVAALIPGDRRLDLKRLTNLLQQKRVSFLPREQVKAATGYEPGAVAPIGMRKVRSIVFDRSLLQNEFVDISSGRPDAGVELRSADLLRLVGSRVESISREEARDA